jgi:3-dehydroquinate dehydratase-2
VRILLLSGPNLTMLGQRDPAVYGRATLDELVGRATAAAQELGAELLHVQGDGEDALIAAVHAAASDGTAAVVVNAGALTHYGLALRDALEILAIPKVELHLSNPTARESFRHVSVVAGVCDGVIAGLGADGYGLAVRAAVGLVRGRG